MNVEVSEAGCTFRFDYSKVYWNSKLDTEHKRITSLFKPGEVVADVMAGIGPFAVPAGKKGVFVWANDKNPESHRYLEDAIQKNKVDTLPVLFLGLDSWLLTLDSRSRNSSSPSTMMGMTSSAHPQTWSLRHPNEVIVPSSSHRGHQGSLQRRPRSQSGCPCLRPSPISS